MAHKELKYDADARKALEQGVDAVANAVKVTSLQRLSAGGGLGPRARHTRDTEGSAGPMTLNDYLPILLLALVLGVFASGSFLASNVLAPRHPTLAKLSPYESGIQPVTGISNDQFPIKFYVIAMLFIVFDIESVFLFPWAVVFRSLGRSGVLEMASFVAFLLAAYVYVWKRGGLEWE
jgi:NADH-quinone oxidoreductase subunit A